MLSWLDARAVLLTDEPRADSVLSLDRVYSGSRLIFVGQQLAIRAPMIEKAEPRRIPPPWSAEEPESRLPVQARRIRMDAGRIAERPLIGPGSR
jgi:hypothetical protein